MTEKEKELGKLYVWVGMGVLISIPVLIVILGMLSQEKTEVISIAGGEMVGVKWGSRLDFIRNKVYRYSVEPDRGRDIIERLELPDGTVYRIDSGVIRKMSRFEPPTELEGLPAEIESLFIKGRQLANPSPPTERKADYFIPLRESLFLSLNFLSCAWSSFLTSTIAVRISSFSAVARRSLPPTFKLTSA
jgi:hypothetical protein